MKGLFELELNETLRPPVETEAQEDTSLLRIKQDESRFAIRLSLLPAGQEGTRRWLIGGRSLSP